MFVLIIIASLILLGILFMYVYPPFGGKRTKGKINLYRHSANFSNKEKFINLIPTKMDMSLNGTISILKDFIKGNPNGRPASLIPVEPLNFRVGDNETKITWFGHSAFLLEIQGKTILLDPMFGKAPSPFPQFGGKRYNQKLPIEIEELPTIDAVLISHDHYDHLDYGSIKKLRNKVRQFIVPLGVGRHLERWGIDQSIIKEMDWWEELNFEGLQLSCTPARHFSGRGLLDRDTTLWCSWVLHSQLTKIFFSGDSGYGPHFREIGEKYGPFDLTLMECGQYDERWSAIHMMPEETVQAQLDVKGKMMIPIHWGAFTLALHDWLDPIDRVTIEAKKRNIAISTPKIGETVIVGTDKYPNSSWWK
jgi:L-ascorbate metabolism protein UlaG (beta-lactamase superfamily)